jgi:hypothetical protein
MRPTPIRQSEAFTRTELLVVIVVVFVVVAMIYPAIPRKRRAATRISCINNLYRIGGAYRVWANEMGQSTKMVVCPADERNPADTLGKHFSNTNLSYFVDVSANNNQPQSLLGGDRNLGPGNEPAPDYGFSPESGKGNDVAIPTNSQTSSVCWSLKMHSKGKFDGAGNIALEDGSCHEVNTLSFRTNWLSHADPTTNWPAGHVPSSPSIRVLFP